MRNLYGNPQTNINTPKYPFERLPIPPPNPVARNTQGLNGNQPNWANNVYCYQPEPKEETRFSFSARKQKNEPDVHQEQYVTPISSRFRNSKLNSQYETKLNDESQRYLPSQRIQQQPIIVSNLSTSRIQPINPQNNVQNKKPMFKQFKPIDNQQRRVEYNRIPNMAKNQRDTITFGINRPQKSTNQMKTLEDGQKKIQHKDRQIAQLQQKINQYQNQKQNLKNNYERIIKEKQAQNQRKDQILMVLERKSNSQNKNAKRGNTIRRPMRSMLQNILSWIRQNIPLQGLKNYFQQNLSDILVSYNQEDLNLNKIIEDLKKKNAELMNGVNQSKRAKQTLQNQNVWIKKINDNIGNQNERLKQQIQFLEQRLKQETNQIHQDYQHQINKLSAQKNDLSNLLKTQQNQNKSIIVINQNYLKLVMEHDKVVKSQKQKANNLLQNQQQLRKKIQQNENSLNKIKYMSKNEQQMKKKLTTSIKQNERLKIHINNLNGLIHNKDNQKELLNSQKENFKQRIMEKQMMLNEKIIQMKKLQEQKQKDIEKIKQLETQIENLKILIAKLKKSTNVMDSFVQYYQKQSKAQENRKQIQTMRRGAQRSNQSILRGTSIRKYQSIQIKEEVMIRNGQSTQDRQYEFRTKIRNPLKF